MKKNIVLIGFMGCGKTTMGIRLSYRLQCILEDTDKWIERNEKRSISEIFAEDGEEAFRKMETKCLKKMAKESGTKIISTGGGLPIREENRKPLKELGYVIYLKISPKEVYERLKGDTTRPLLCCEDPYAKMQELLALRDPHYTACADAVLCVDQKSQEEVLEEILTLLRENGIIEGEST